MPPFNPKPPAQPASDSEKKLDQGLRDLARSAGTGKIGAKAEEQQKVKVEIIANNATDIPKLKEALIRDGATIISDLGNHVWASIPVSSIGPLSQLDIVWTMALTRPTSSAQ